MTISNDRLTAKVATEQGLIEVEARDCGVPGLIITREGFFGPDNGKWEASRKWQVTHFASGRTLTNHPFERLGDALTCAANLAPLADWTLDGDDLRAVPGLHQEIQTAIRKVEHDRFGQEIVKLRKTLS